MLLMMCGGNWLIHVSQRTLLLMLLFHNSLCYYDRPFGLSLCHGGYCPIIMTVIGIIGFFSR